MCRMAIYKGPEILLSKIISEPPHSLIKQSYAASEMATDGMNTDGFGFAWYCGFSKNAAVYRHTLPITNDPNVMSMADKISAPIVMAHVRGASDGMPVGITNTHPFNYGRYTFMHNGTVDFFWEKLFADISPQLDSRLLPLIKGNTDSERIFALWLSFLKLDENASIEAQVEALKGTLTLLETAARKFQTDLVINICLSDGESIMALRFHYGKRQTTLYECSSNPAFPKAMVIASEPLDSHPNWTMIPERSLLTIDKNNKRNLIRL